MMKRLALLSAIFILIAGCGVKMDTPSPSVDADILIEHGWNFYDAGHFEEAKAAFDSVFLFAIDKPEAFTGLAWSLIQLGNYSEALPYLRLAMTADPNYYKPIVTPVTDEIDTAHLDSIVYDAYTVMIYEVPVKQRPVAAFKKVKLGSNPVDVYWMTDTSVVIIAPTNARDSAVCTVTYDHIDTSPEGLNLSIVPEVGIGIMAANQGLGEYDEAISGAKAAIYYWGDSLRLSHYPGLNRRDIDISLATIYLKAGYYMNVVQLLEQLDENFTFPAGLDPYDANNVYILLEELARLRSGN